RRRVVDAMLNTASPSSAPVRTRSITDGTYGSDDASGLVWAYEFAPGHTARPIDSGRAAERLAGEGDADSCLWLHFNLSNSRAEPWLRQRLTLPRGFYDLIVEGPSTRVESVDNALVAVIRDVPFFGSEGRSDASMTICVDARLMISARTQQ